MHNRVRIVQEDMQHRHRNRHAARQWQTFAGGLLFLGSLFLLVPGINEYSAAIYTDSGGNTELGLLLLIAGGAVFLCAAALLGIGYVKHRQYMNRPRTYENRHENYTLQAEGRGQNPHEMPGRGYQTGIF